jgi:hypothetical protein
MDAILTQFGMDTRAPVDMAMLLEDLLNQSRNSGIFSRLCTRLTVFPGVAAALGNVQGLAEQLNRILLTLLCDELILYARLREKMPIASDRISPKVVSLLVCCNK